MPPDVDFDSTPAVEGFVRARFAALYPGCSDAWLRRVFADIDDLFAGRNAAYSAIDLRYHNLRHTLMATTCMVLLEGMNSARGDQRIEVRDFELAVAGVLMHDTGYMKLRCDTEGTGAKYTFCHILRSCAFAASYLPQVGVSEIEIENVMSAINCTGPHAEVSRLRFRDPVSRIVGCALATADYVGQLADPHYPDKLGELFSEFHESDVFANIPPERRLFKSEEELVAKTPAFWHGFVKPKLDNDFQAVYRFLARPVGSRQNGYMDAIEENFARITAKAAAS
jgi:hypothetical protein